MRQKWLWGCVFSLIMMVGGGVRAQEVSTIPCQGFVLDHLPSYLWNRHDERCLLDTATPAHISIAYPAPLDDTPPFVKAAVKEVIQQHTAAFLTTVARLANPPGTYPALHLMALAIRLEVFTARETVSVLLTTIHYDIAATTTIETLTFDLSQNRTLTLDDIFIEGVNPYAILAHPSRNTLQNVEAATITSVVEATIPITENYSHWVLTETALRLYFEGWRIVGPGAGGDTPQIVDIPLAELRGVLRREYVSTPQSP